MKLRICLALLLTVLSVLMPTQSVIAQDDLERLLIVEVAVGGKQEFIEIYNPGEMPVDLSCFNLQYRVATSTKEEDWNNKYRFACNGADGEPTVDLAPHSRLLLANYDELTVENELRFAGGLRNEGGQLRLAKIDQAEVMVHDMLGYGDSVTGEDGKGAAKTPPEGQSLKRKVDEDGLFLDTDDNAADFMISEMPTPQRDDIDVDKEPTDPDPKDDTDPGKGSGEYAILQLNEILPDPVPPEQDDADEFVEIYNPTDAQVSLKGYTLESGNTFQYGFTFGEDAVIAARGFVVVRSAASDVTLSNSGSKVRLLAPDEKVQDEVSYPLALVGQSYNRTADGWQWSITASPGSENTITILPPPVKETKAPVSKKVAAPKTNVAKPKAATTTKKPAVKAAGVAPSLSKPAAIDNAPNMWILLPIGTLVVGYALYEYRKDVSMWWRKLLLATKTKQ